MREATLQARILRRLKAADGCKALVTHGLEVGTPDILGSYRGRALAIEVKTGGNCITKVQGVRLREWRDAGAFAVVAREGFDVTEFLEAIREEVDS